MRIDHTAVLRGLTVTAALLVVACGDSTPHVQQAAAPPLTESSVKFQQTGNAAVQIVPESVHYHLDDARLLEVVLTVHSTAKGVQTVTVRGSFYDKAGKLIADATGSQLGVAPGSTDTVTLSGPTPTGTIASGTFEVSTIPAPTPLNGGT
jgi:hypothetical protein